MIKINSHVYTYVNHIKKIVYNKKYVLLYGDNNKYLYIDYFINNQNDISCRCLKRINNEDDFSLFLLDEVNYDKLDTIIELYKNSLIVHDFSLNEKKIIYDYVIEKLNSIYEYYYGVQDRLESSFELKDSDKFLLINSSLIYKLLSMGHYYLKVWFNNENSNRIVLNIDDVSNDNFYNGYIINMDKAYKDNYVFEISKYYKYHYLDSDLFNKINYFFHDFSTTTYEKCLFYAYLVIIPTVSTYNSVDVYSLIKYVEDTYSYLEKNKEEYDGDKEKFKEE